MVTKIFICHTSSDKTFVGPLATILESRGLDVWYDEFKLGVGDSLTKGIDRGLATSNYGLVVFSPEFFGRPWPESELAGIRNRLHAGEQKKLFPIYHGVSNDDIRKRYPPLADIYALNTMDGIENLSTELIETIYPRKLEPPLYFESAEEPDIVVGGLESIDGDEVHWQHLTVKNISDRPVEGLCFEVNREKLGADDLSASFLQWKSEPHNTKKTLQSQESALLDICHRREERRLRMQVILNMERHYFDIEFEEPIRLWCISSGFARRMVVRTIQQTGCGLWTNVEWIEPKR